MEQAMDLVIKRASPTERLPLARMLELYQYELSDIWDQDLDEHGDYGYNLDRFWSDKRCVPFVALQGGHYCGFALVDSFVKVGSDGFWMDQFFVLKKHRRRGVGRSLAFKVFEQLPGRWEVGQMANNIAAQAFWRRIIAQFSDGRFQEHQLTEGWWQGIVQMFESNAADLPKAVTLP